MKVSDLIDVLRELYDNLGEDVEVDILIQDTDEVFRISTVEETENMLNEKCVTIIV